MKFINPIKLELVHPDGTTELLDEVLNGMTDEGRQYAVGVALNSETQLTSWHIGLISDAGFTGVNDTDTLALHAGWTEETGYTETVRQVWTPVLVGNALVNTVAAQFNFVSETTLKGILVASDNVKGGSTGKLWSTGLFSGDRVIPAGTAINITYQVEAV